MAFLSENGDVSTIRLVTIGIPLIFMGVWAYVSVIKQELQPLDIEQVGLIMAALAAKVVQKGKENKPLEEK